MANLFITVELLSMAALLSGKVAVVTGAASKLGQAIARRFIEQGARVILANNNMAPCESLQAQINQNRTGGPVAHAMDCDVSNPSNILTAVQKANSIYGKPVDIFYNNAAVKNLYPPNSSIINTTSFNKTMAVNVQSVIASIEHAGNVMRTSGNKDGVNLCTGSTVGPHGDVVPSMYSISKAAVMGVVRATAAELESDGVRVNAISSHGVLGTFDEVVLKKMFPQADDTLLHAWIKSCGTNNVTVEQMANAGVFLASDKGKGINGQNFMLDGEFTI